MKIFGLDIKLADESAATRITAGDNFVPLQMGQLVFGGTSMSLSAVYRCASLISDSIATMPIRAKRGLETIDDHNAVKVFGTNAYLTRFDLIKRMVTDVLLRGNGYAYIARSSDGSPIALRYLEPSDVLIEYKKEKDELFYNVPLVSRHRIEPCNIIHLRMHTRPDGITGISVLSAAEQTLRTSKYAEATAENYYSTGGTFKGVISTTTRFNSKQEEDFLRKWNTQMSGAGNGVAMLTGGEMAFHPLSSNAADQQLLDVRKWNAATICQFFGVHPSLIGIDGGASVGNVTQLQQMFVLNTIMPIVGMMEGEFTKKLISTREPDTKIDLDESVLMRADKVAQANFLRALSDGGILSRNEVRRMLGYAPVEGADDLIVAYTKIEDNRIGNTNNK